MGVLLLLHLGLEAQGPPVLLDKPIMLSQGSLLLRTMGEYRHLSRGTSYLHTPLMLHCIPHRRWLVAGHLPLLYDFVGKTSVGNVSFVGKYLLTRKDGMAKTLRTTAKWRIDLPNGSGEGPIDFDYDDYKMQASYILGYESLRYGLLSEVGYRYLHNSLSDDIILHLGASIPLLKPVYPSKQINLYFGYQAHYEPQTGQYFVRFGQGAQYAYNKLTLDLAVRQNLVENEPEEEKVRLNFFLGTRYLVY